MIKTLHKDLLRPPGRTHRAGFIAGLVVIIASVMLQSMLMRLLGNNLPSFLLGLIWMCFNLYMIYSLFARRLHDMDLSVGPLFAVIFLTILVIAFTVWAGGGGDYFEALMENPSIAEDEEASRALIEKYQADMVQSIGWARWANMVPLMALSILCAVKSGINKENNYGPVPA